LIRFLRPLLSFAGFGCEQSQQRRDGDEQNEEQVFEMHLSNRYKVKKLHR
jgi:hypothetical protein